MDQNQTVDNDLQKAIDDITNNTNIDPVFSDPVAAPSSVPEGDTGELDDPIGPFTATPEVPASTPIQGAGGFIPEPAAPPFGDFGTPAVDATTFSGEALPGTMPPVPEAPIPSAPVPPVPSPEAVQPLPVPDPQAVAADIPEPLPQPPVPAPVQPEEMPTALTSDVQQIKVAALRDLVPLIDRLNMTPSQRFNICHDVFESLKDNSIAEQAYRAASAIPDDTERAEALLRLVETIDKA